MTYVEPWTTNIATVPPEIDTRAARQQLNLSRSQLARLLGVGAYQIRNWEYGKYSCFFPESLAIRLKEIGYDPTKPTPTVDDEDPPPPFTVQSSPTSITVTIPDKLSITITLG